MVASTSDTSVVGPAELEKAELPVDQYAGARLSREAIRARSHGSWREPRGPRPPGDGLRGALEAIHLPGPDDPVLAAAIKARAQMIVIVTRNLRDFPSAALDGWDMRRSLPTSSSSIRLRP